MEYCRVYVRPGTEFVVMLPHSEVCMHMRVAGKKMGARFAGPRSIQLFDIETHEDFSFPILLGEAGIFTEEGKHYIVQPTS